MNCSNQRYVELSFQIHLTNNSVSVFYETTFIHTSVLLTNDIWTNHLHKAAEPVGPPFKATLVQVKNSPSSWAWPSMMNFGPRSSPASTVRFGSQELAHSLWIQKYTITAQFGINYFHKIVMKSIIKYLVRWIHKKTASIL